MTTAHLGYIVRDHDAAKFAARKAQMQHIADCLNGRYGAGTVELDIRGPAITICWRRFSPASTWWRMPARPSVRRGWNHQSPVRGGTDGATLQAIWACPARTSAQAASTSTARVECITAEKMDQGVEILLNLVDLYK